MHVFKYLPYYESLIKTLLPDILRVPKKFLVSCISCSISSKWMFTHHNDLKNCHTHHRFTDHEVHQKHGTQEVFDEFAVAVKRHKRRYI